MKYHQETPDEKLRRAEKKWGFFSLLKTFAQAAGLFWTITVRHVGNCWTFIKGPLKKESVFVNPFIFFSASPLVWHLRVNNNSMPRRVLLSWNHSGNPPTFHVQTSLLIILLSPKSPRSSVTSAVFCICWEFQHGNIKRWRMSNMVNLKPLWVFYWYECVEKCRTLTLIINMNSYY